MGIYTASFWTKITSSANIPPFDPNVYTLKATIDDTGHQMPGSPYTYPINLTQGQNLFIVFTAPSGANEIVNLCISSSYREIGSGYYNVRMNLRSGSCAASGSFVNTLGADIDVYYTIVDDQNNYYYEGPISITQGNSYGQQAVQLQGDNMISSLTVEQWTNPNLSYNILGPCGACGVPNYVSFDNNYAVVQPASITSSIFNAQIINISSSNYGIKISASVDGLLSNVDTEISWSVIGNLPIYYAGGFGATYYSTAISASIQRNNCPSGYEGSYVLYTLPASQSSATSSQIDAQNAAQAYFNSTSQSYANTYGSCTATGSVINVYAKAIMGNGAQLNWTNTSQGTSGSVDFIDSVGCNYWGDIVANNGDNLIFETDGFQAISGNDTGPCPSTAAGCAFYYNAVGGTQSVYITVDGSISC